MIPRRTQATVLALGIGGLFVTAACNAVLGIEEAELLSTTTTTTTTTTGTSECDSALQCDDQKICTQDSCNANHECVHANLNLVDAPAEYQQPGDCQRLVCVDGDAQNVDDDLDVPSSSTVCVVRGCSSGSPTEQNASSGTDCTADGIADHVVCNGLGDCVQCASNNDCTPPDTCGPPAAALFECGCDELTCAEAGKTCGFLANDLCGGTNINCNNLSQDGTETDVDCGGSQTACNIRCNPGKKCLANSDCAFNSCCGATGAKVCCGSGQTCVAETCQ